MNNGMQKYLMIALGAVFLWGAFGAIHAQELKTTILAMKNIELRFKKDQTLLTPRQANKLDLVLLHMQNKPAMRIALQSLFSNEHAIISERFRMIDAYLHDNGVNLARRGHKAVSRQVKCGDNCYERIIIVEVSQ